MIGQVQIINGVKQIVPVTDTTPVDEVTANNMQSVTSNAVYNALQMEGNDTGLVNITPNIAGYLGVTAVYACKKNNLVYMHITGTYSGAPTTSTDTLVSGLPTKYRPSFEQIVPLLGWNGTQYVPVARGIIYPDGTVKMAETSWNRNTSIRIGFIYML